MQLVSDTLSSYADEFKGKLTDIFVAMLATNTSIEDCGAYARDELMTLSHLPGWVVLVGLNGSFVLEDLSEREQIILSSK